MTMQMYSLALCALTSLLLTGCGADDAATDAGTDAGTGNSADETEQVTDTGEQAPQDNSANEFLTAASLPAVNPQLNTTSPAGVWMLAVSETSDLPNEDDSMNPFHFEKSGRELVVIADDGEGHYEMTRCDSGWRITEKDIVTSADGYSWTVSTTQAADESGVESTTTQSLTVTYANNNQTLSATGSEVTTPVGENLTLTIDGVKVSDETDFAASDELSFALGLEYTNLGTEGTLTEGNIECMGVLRGRKTTESETDVWQMDQSEYTYFDTNNKQMQFYRIDQNVDGTERRTLSAIINTPAVTTILLNSCGLNETECLNAVNWSETISEDDSGMAFDLRFEVVENQYVINPIALTPWTAFLWPHDGDYYHSTVSASVVAPAAP